MVEKVCQWPVTPIDPPTGPGSSRASPSLAMEDLASSGPEEERKDEGIDRSSDAERGQRDIEEGASPLIKKPQQDQEKPTIDLICGDIPCRFEVGLYTYNPQN